MSIALQEALTNYTEHMEERDHPACATPEEYNAWLVHETEINTKPLRAFFCRDCTPAYRLQMKLESRCCQLTVDISKIVD